MVSHAVQPMACGIDHSQRHLSSSPGSVFIFFVDRRESSQLEASLWEQAERSTAARKEEVVRQLDEAAGRARERLNAVLQVWAGGDVSRFRRGLLLSLLLYEVYR